MAGNSVTRVARLFFCLTFRLSRGMPAKKRANTREDRLRSLRGRIGGLALASQRDSRSYTAAARRSFLGRFYDEVDPDRALPEPERERRAAAAKSRYFTQLAYRSAKVRGERTRVRGRPMNT